jgi:uncharacterized membrane protein YeiB
MLIALLEHVPREVFVAFSCLWLTRFAAGTVEKVWDTARYIRRSPDEI